MTAPIALFVYNRPSHTKRLIQSLLSNPQAGHSPIVVFCDGPKTGADPQPIEEVRQVVRSMLPHANVVEQEQNQGLAASIIAGVSQCVNEHGRVIVLEDDLVLSSSVLDYFNRALDYYEAHEKVGHISGYMFPVNTELEELFFYHEMSCWGWATWKRAWDSFEPDSQTLLDQIRTQDRVQEFDAQGSANFSTMLRKQCEGAIDSWAIRWYATNFLLKRLALHPGKSLIANEGFDGSGVHCNVEDRFEVEIHDTTFTHFPDRVEVSKKALDAMIAYRGGSPSRPRRLGRRLKSWLRVWR